jgi:hypothetical protein
MSEERGAELFRALHAIIDAVTNLNLRDLEAEAKAAVASEKAQAESSTQGASTSASASSKGKAKDPDPDWTEVSYNPVRITPLSTRPRFSQVVESPSESPIVPPSCISVEAVSGSSSLEPSCHRGVGCHEFPSRSRSECSGRWAGRPSRPSSVTVGWV